MRWRKRKDEPKEERWPEGKVILFLCLSHPISSCTSPIKTVEDDVHWLEIETDSTVISTSPDDDHEPCHKRLCLQFLSLPAHVFMMLSFLSGRKASALEASLTRLREKEKWKKIRERAFCNQHPLACSLISFKQNTREWNSNCCFVYCLYVCCKSKDSISPFATRKHRETLPDNQGENTWSCFSILLYFVCRSLSETNFLLPSKVSSPSGKF